MSSEETKVGGSQEPMDDTWRQLSPLDCELNGVPFTRVTIATSAPMHSSSQSPSTGYQANVKRLEYCSEGKTVVLTVDCVQTSLVNVAATAVVKKQRPFKEGAVFAFRNGPHTLSRRSRKDVAGWQTELEGDLTLSRAGLSGMQVTHVEFEENHMKVQACLFR